MIHLSQLQHNLVRWLLTYHCPGQEGLVPLPAAPFALLPSASGGATGICHFPSHLYPLCVGLPHHWSRHDVLLWRLHVTGLYSQHRGGWGKPTLFYLGEVGWWETTGHCSPEIQCDTAHLGYPPVLAPPTSANCRWSGHAEQNPQFSGSHAGHPLHLWPSCPWLCRASHEVPQCHGNPSWSSWGFTSETLVATYKAIVRLILSYAAPIWFT